MYPAYISTLCARILKKPIIALNSCYINEFRSVGIHIEVANNITDLAYKIITILNKYKYSISEIKKKADINYQIVSRYFNNDIVVQQYIELYKQNIDN